MSVRKVFIKQCREAVNRNAAGLARVDRPNGGWVRTVRTALGMSVSQLARRLGVSRAAIYQAEQAEPDGKLTLKRMSEIASAMDCRFVYGFVPAHQGQKIEDVIEARAHRLAHEIVQGTSTHMALEAQSLTTRQLEDETTRVARDILADRPSSIWDDQE